MAGARPAGSPSRTTGPGRARLRWPEPVALDGGSSAREHAHRLLAGHFRRSCDTPGMVSTGARVRALGALFEQLGRTSTPQLSGPRMEHLPPEAAHEIHRLYRALGGVSSEPRLRPGPWDLVLDDGVVLELDEELHFNRFREVALHQHTSERLPWTTDYRRLALKHEPECLRAGRWGARWTSPSSVRMFGQAAPPGELDGPGAPRWKQRALYDALKDAAAAAGVVRLVRLSIYDDLEGLSMEFLLRHGSHAARHLTALGRLLAERTFGT